MSPATGYRRKVCRRGLHDISTIDGRFFKNKNDKVGTCARCYAARRPKRRLGYCVKRGHMLVREDGSLTSDAKQVTFQKNGKYYTTVTCRACKRISQLACGRVRAAEGWVNLHCVVRGCSRRVDVPPGLAGSGRTFVCRAHRFDPPGPFLSLIQKAGKTIQDFSLPAYDRPIPSRRPAWPRR